MAKLTIPPVTSLGNTTSAIGRLNDNSDLIEAAVEKTLSRDGTAPNQMEADFDLNSYDLLNGGNISAASLTLDGVPVTPVNLGVVGDYVLKSGDTMTGPLVFSDPDSEETWSFSTDDEEGLTLSGSTYNQILSLNPGTASAGNTGQTITGRFRYSMPVVTRAGGSVVSSGSAGVATSLVRVNEASSVNIVIRANVADLLDFDVGNFFSVMQEGLGSINITAETGDIVLRVPAGYTATTRGQYSVISATLFSISGATQTWVISGDMAEV